MARLENKICEYCGKEFMQNSPSQVYCSAECRIAHKKMIDKANFVSKKCTVEKVCVICGKTFIANTASQMYCSPECKVVANHERQKELRKKYRAQKEEEKRKANKKPKLSLRDICCLAFAEHLSYGQYCQKYGL